MISFPAYNGVYRKAQPILGKLEPGNSNGLTLKRNSEKFTFLYNNHPIAKLSSRAANFYKEKISQGYDVEKIIFLASIKWYANEDQDPAQSFEALKSWYTGLFQIVLIKNSKASEALLQPNLRVGS